MPLAFGHIAKKKIKCPEQDLFMCVFYGWMGRGGLVSCTACSGGACSGGAPNAFCTLAPVQCIYIEHAYPGGELGVSEATYSS